MTDLTAVTIPTVADIEKWYKLQEQLTELKAAEAMLRRRLADHFFPTPTEGSADNKYALNDGTGAILQMDHKINRKVLEPELDAYKAAMRDPGANVPKLPLNKLIKYKPELVKAEYNKLTEAEQKAVDTFLDVKPGMPDLKVVIPKRK
jgi:hypothetical protein